MKYLEKQQAFRLKLAEKNKRFKKMNLTNKRLSIARDLKEYILQGLLIPTTMCYLNVVNGQELLGTNKELVDILGTVECRVCVKGGLLASVIGYKDNFSAIHLESSHNSESGTRSHSTMKEISQYWHPFELALMEVAFERDVTTGGYFSSNDGLASKYHQRRTYREFVLPARHFSYSNTEQRLLEILEVLLKNKGRFILPGYTLEELDAAIEEVGS